MLMVRIQMPRKTGSGSYPLKTTRIRNNKVRPDPAFKKNGSGSGRQEKTESGLNKAKMLNLYFRTQQHI